MSAGTAEDLQRRVEPPQPGAPAVEYPDKGCSCEQYEGAPETSPVALPAAQQGAMMMNFPGTAPPVLPGSGRFAGCTRGYADEEGELYE